MSSIPYVASYSVPRSRELSLVLGNFGVIDQRRIFLKAVINLGNFPLYTMAIIPLANLRLWHGCIFSSVAER